jgi:SAM-dependent methyltransferase
MSKSGASAVGIDVSDKWLLLAEINAYDEVDLPFLKCDASTREAYVFLEEYGKFDFIVLNDVFEHIYDTDGLVYNLSRLLAKDGIIYYKVPNGLNPRNVLCEGHKKVFGISLLPPDYWSMFIDAPFHIYYRRWGFYRAILDLYGLKGHKSLDSNHDKDIEQSRRHIANDLENIKKHLVVDNFSNPEHFQAVQNACKYYFKEVENDLEHMEWAQLHHKYRLTFWKGLIANQ